MTGWLLSFTALASSMDQSMKEGRDIAGSALSSGVEATKILNRKMNLKDLILNLRNPDIITASPPVAAILEIKETVNLQPLI